MSNVTEAAARVEDTPGPLFPRDSGDTYSAACPIITGLAYPGLPTTESVHVRSVAAAKHSPVDTLLGARRNAVR